MPFRNAVNHFLSGALVACAMCLPMAAQSAAASAAPSGYNQPPKNILVSNSLTDVGLRY